MDERERTIRRQSVASGLLAIAAVQRPWPAAIALVAIGSAAPILWPGWPSAHAVAVAWLGGAVASVATTRGRAAAVTLAVGLNAMLAAVLVSPFDVHGVLTMRFGSGGWFGSWWWQGGAALPCAFALAAALWPFGRVPRTVAALAVVNVAAGWAFRLVPIPFDSGLVWLCAVTTLLLAPRVRIRWLAVILFVGGAALYAEPWWRWWDAAELFPTLLGALAVATIGGAAARLGEAQQVPADEVVTGWVLAADRRPWPMVAVVFTSWSLILIQAAGIWGTDEMDLFRTVVLTTLATHAVRPSRFGADTFAPLVLGLGLAWLAVDRHGKLGVAQSDEVVRGAVLAAFAFAWARVVPDGQWVRRAGFVAVVVVFALPIAWKVRSGSPAGAVFLAAVPIALSAIVRSEIRLAHAALLAAALVVAQRTMVVSAHATATTAFRFETGIRGALAAVAVVTGVVVLACAVRRACWMCVLPEDHPVFTDMKKA